MNSTAPSKQNRFPWLLAFCVAVLSVAVAVSGLTIYPRWRAQQRKEELVTTPDSFEAHKVIGKMLRAGNPYADAALAELSSQDESAVFAEEHRVVLFFDDETGQPYSVTRWAADNMSPNITAKFVNPRIVENIPEAVTIAATNEFNGSTCLFFFTYKHNGHACNLSPQELEEFAANGYWNEYVAQNGDPVAKKKENMDPAGGRVMAAMEKIGCR